MDDVLNNNSLISLKEADEVVAAPKQAFHTPILIFVGLLLVSVATLLILLLLSLKGSRTGWEAVLPFLDKTEIQTLQTN